MAFIGDTARLMRFVVGHPIGRRRPLRSIARVVVWQARSRLSAGPFTYPWVESSKLVLRRGMTGATGNLYLGLWEFADMGFALHMLRSGDLFFDIGANVGTFTVLAAKVRGARTVAFEPDTSTAERLMDNVRANAIEALVTVERVALGARDGEIGFTIGLDAVNRVAEADEPQQRVPVRRLDSFAGGVAPVFIKMDVEGHETEVLRGATATLADPALLAIEIETTDEAALAMLADAGFVRRWYDPFTRALSSAAGSAEANNSLFVRDEGQVRARVAAAPVFTVLGIRI